jgi:hypothetical protein
MRWLPRFLRVGIGCICGVEGGVRGVRFGCRAVVGLAAPRIAGAALAERAGMAGGAVNTVRQLGYAPGVAMSGTALTSRMRVETASRG